MFRIKLTRRIGWGRDDFAAAQIPRYRIDLDVPVVERVARVFERLTLRGEAALRALRQPGMVGR